MQQSPKVWGGDPEGEQVRPALLIASRPNGPLAAAAAVLGPLVQSWSYPLAFTLAVGDNDGLE